MPAPALLLRGGRVLDPAQGLDGTLDVRLRDGRVEAVGPGLPAGDAEVLDAAGLFVLPGLIDAHVHCFTGLRGVHLSPEVGGVSRGVTTVVDAGSVGCGLFPIFHDYVIANARTRVLGYLNLSSVAGTVERDFPRLGHPSMIEPDGIAETVARYRDSIVGLKLNAMTSAVGDLGLEPLRRGMRIADEVGVPVLVHIGETARRDLPGLPVTPIVEMLRPGDTITHMYTAAQGGLLDANKHLFPAVREARDRGVRFDIGHGVNNLSWDVAQRLLDMGFPPDTVSTDLGNRSVCGPVYDLPTTMSKLLVLGIPLGDVVAMATSHAAALIGREDELGSLAPGRVADVSVLRLAERPWEAVDSSGERRTVEQHLEPVFAVRAGEVIYPRPPDGP
jgi:dihydroorotase